MHRTLLVLAVVGCLCGLSLAGDVGSHYTNGVEGLNCGSVPPPGLYLRSYNLFYTADRLNDDDGDDVGAGFNVNVLATVQRVIWITDWKLLGADYGMDAALPLVYTDIDVDAAGVDDELLRFGDIWLEPLLLGWHGFCWDAGAGLGLYAPTGCYDRDHAATPGLNYWTGMLTLSGTYYFDPDKIWNASILCRYETHAEHQSDDIVMGDDFHFEWGVGYRFAELWQAGLTGYCQWQVTEDSGDDVTYDKSDKDRVFAIGPEVNYTVPDWKLNAALRTQVEFGARDRSEGWITTLMLTKAF